MGWRDWCGGAVAPEPPAPPPKLPPHRQVSLKHHPPPPQQSLGIGASSRCPVPSAQSHPSSLLTDTPVLSVF